MLQRQTQTAAFWRDQFEVNANDLDFLYNLLLDTQTPKHSWTQLATALIQEYMRREEAKIGSELSKGAVYLPKERLYSRSKSCLSGPRFYGGRSCRYSQWPKP